MSWLRRSRGMFARLRLWMPLVLELALILASARVCLLLSLDQGYFERYHVFYFWLLEHFPHEEWKWAVLAGTAAALKAAGILIMMVYRFIMAPSDKAADAAFLLRSAGWCLSVIFWGTFGLSIQIGDPWSIGAICCAALAQLSIAALVMGPAMPEEAHVTYQG